ncbi:MAG: TetR/AcrR family transcriptional regulator [Cytophagaceae bacterium]
MPGIIKLQLNEKLYVRDPDETELGRKIVSHSVRLIDEVGFESFSFKKLAIEIKSTEASVYRYFENKQKLLLYLVNCYWIWLRFQLHVKTESVKNPKEKLKIALRIITESNMNNPVTGLDESALFRIVVNESQKVFLVKNVDTANKEGLFREYKLFCKLIAEIISELNPKYKFANTLVSTIIEGAHHQLFFADHFPSLTDLKKQEQDCNKLNTFLEHLVLAAILPKS